MCTVALQQNVAIQVIFLVQPPYPPLSLPLTQSINPYLNQVVKVVLPSDPAVVGLQTVGLVGDILCVQTFTVVELAFEQLERQREKEKSVRRLGCH